MPTLEEVKDERKKLATNFKNNIVKYAKLMDKKLGQENYVISKELASHISSYPEQNIEVVELTNTMLSNVIRLIRNNMMLVRQIKSTPNTYKLRTQQTEINSYLEAILQNSLGAKDTENVRNLINNLDMCVEIFVERISKQTKSIQPPTLLTLPNTPLSSKKNNEAHR